MKQTAKRTSWRSVAWSVFVLTVVLTGIFVVYPAITAYRLFALEYGDSASIGFARQSLRSRDSLVRRGATRGLGRIGPAAKEATPELLAAMKVDCWQVESECAWALGQFDQPAPPVIDGLTSALGHDHGEVRRYAAFSLSRYGVAASSAIPALTERLPDEHMGYMAARSLGEIGPAAKSAIEPMTRLLSHPNFAVRAEAAAALSKLGSLPPESVAALKRLAHDENEFVRQELSRSSPGLVEK